MQRLIIEPINRSLVIFIISRVEYFPILVLCSSSPVIKRDSVANDKRRKEEGTPFGGCEEGNGSQVARVKGE